MAIVYFPTKGNSGKHTVPMRVPFGQTDGAILAINFSIVITRWYAFSGSTLNHLSNGVFC